MQEPKPVSPAESDRCALCGRQTTACYVVHSGGSGFVGECHGMAKDVLGLSRNRSPIEARVCVGCGYIALFAKVPGLFRVELPPDSGERSDLPIPIERDP